MVEGLTIGLNRALKVINLIKLPALIFQSINWGDAWHVWCSCAHWYWGEGGAVRQRQQACGERWPRPAGALVIPGRCGSPG